MQKPKKSGPALFMYGVIGITLLLATLCLSLYYGGKARADAVLWTGIVAFMILYHFWLRIIMGNVTKLFSIHYDSWWFREKAFEKKLYQRLRVKKWKNKALTYNPESFSLKKHSLEEIALVMTKAELDHWVNQLISLFSILFALLWGQFWIFLLTAVAAMLFDGQFIVIQRYNRPKVLRLMKRQAEKPVKV